MYRYGNRIERKSIDNGSGTKYVWDILNNNIIQERASHTSLFYVYGASGLECSIDTQTGKIVNYYHGDIRGSVVFTTKNIRDTKKKITFNKYDDFGKIVNGGSGGLADFKYLGKHGILNEHQDEGLYYIKARYYDATLGRFLTQDPIWSTNLYPYANNNPVTNADTNGKDWYASYSTGVFSGLSGEYYKTSYARCNQTSNPALCKAGKWVGFNGAVLAKIGEVYVNVRIARMVKTYGASNTAAKDNIKLLPQFTKSTIDDAVNLVMRNSNDVKHIFAKKHNLGSLVNKLGGQENTIRAVLNAGNGRFPASGVFKNLPVNVDGKTIYLRGSVVNGVPRISTMFIP